MSLSDLTDEDLLAVVVPIMDNLMDASTRIDYEAHGRDFADRAKASLSEANFRRICEGHQSEKGYFADRELLGILSRPGSVVVVWKQRFTKVPGEFQAELMLSESAGRPMIERVMVI